MLIPLTAVGAVLVAVWPGFRRRAGWIVVAVGIAALVSTWFAKESGEALSELVDGSPALDRHESLGQILLLTALPMFALLVVYLVAELVQRREGQELPKGVAVVLSVLLVLASLGAVVQTAVVGHSGAEAVWQDEPAGTDADADDVDGDEDAELGLSAEAGLPDSPAP